MSSGFVFFFIIILPVLDLIFDLVKRLVYIIYEYVIWSKVVQNTQKSSDDVILALTVLL